MIDAYAKSKHFFFSRQSKTLRMKKASTVIPIREISRGFEVLMVQRKGSARFMSNMHVFPGGVQETPDGSPSWAGAEPERVCAMRELFEEVGILPGLTQKLPQTELVSLRKSCTDTPSLFFDMCKKLISSPSGLDFSRLKPWSHWITPEQEKYRYDTSFFVLSVSSEESSLASADESEVRSHRWLSPLSWLERHARGEVSLAPPTWATLTELAQLKTLDGVMKSVRSMKPLEPTLGTTEDGGLLVALPGDEMHKDSKKNGGSTGRRRIVMLDGKYKWIDTVSNHTVPTSSL